jgi:hypothetical protein
MTIFSRGAEDRGQGAEGRGQRAKGKILKRQIWNHIVMFSGII